MPSPFPGMDPYLEDPSLWPGVHHWLITFVGDYLTDQLRPKYVARIQERVYISDDDDPGREAIIPDLVVVEGRDHPRRRRHQSSAAGGVEVAEAVEITRLIDREIHEARLEIIDVAQRTVVTVIGLLSPTNKISGAVGRKSYRKQRNEVLGSASHFVEIDLLRKGKTFVAKSMVPPHDYLVYVSRRTGHHDRRVWVWPIRLDQRLPVISIPLREPDPDAKLDLQEVLNAVYDRAGYDLDIDYGREPVPPLAPGQAKWAKGLLKKTRSE